MGEERLTRLTIQGAVARLEICREEVLNALSRQVVDELDAHFDRLAGEKGVKVLLVWSLGNFAAGADITQMVHCDPQQARAFSFSSTYEKLAQLPFPTIAVMEGYALGGGLELALACDMRIAAQDARMGLPEITLGIMPGAGGTVRLPALVGRAKAMEMICMGRPVDAQTALAMGLVNLVVPGEELEEQVERWCKRIALQSRVALEAAKRSVLQGQDYRQMQQSIAREGEIWAGLFESYDQREGMTAFLEKRKPVFQDR